MEIGYIDTPEEWRDVIIMAYALTGTLFFMATFIFVTVSGLMGYNIFEKIRTILKINVMPATENVKATTENVRGAVEYISDTAVKPIVKVYAASAAARRFASVIIKAAGDEKGTRN